MHTEAEEPHIVCATQKQQQDQEQEQQLGINKIGHEWTNQNREPRYT